MHQPFPSSDIFRSLTYREELLRGMLCADHIGFHLFEWAKNFLACCRRLLACTFEAKRGGGLVVTYNGRQVSITCSHMGIEPSMLLPKLTKPQVVGGAQKLRAQLAHAELVIASVDTLEGLCGVPLKLLSFESFLREHPHRASRTVRPAAAPPLPPPPLASRPALHRPHLTATSGAPHRLGTLGVRSSRCVGSCPTRGPTTTTRSGARCWGWWGASTPPSPTRSSSRSTPRSAAVTDSCVAPAAPSRTPGPRRLRGANGQGRRAHGAPGVPMRSLPPPLSSRAPRRRRCTA
jgi:hypothetical protein